MACKEETVLIRYYNVLFFLRFKVGTDDFKKNILLGRICSGEDVKMKDISSWCKIQKVDFLMKFVYRKDFSIVANLWNLYSYSRFRLEYRFCLKDAEINTQKK